MTVDRRSFITGAVALTAIGATTGPAAPAILRGRGQFRSLALVNNRTGEWVNTVYWIEGDYIPEAMDAANRILRDWRQDAIVRMDPTVLDILAATHKLLDTTEPFDTTRWSLVSVS